MGQVETSTFQGLQESQTAVRGSTGEEGRSVLFASLMDFCHLKHFDLEKHFQNYKERVPEEGNGKDDSGYRAVFAEQGGAASPLTGRTFLKLPDALALAGEANDAVLGCTQVHMSEAPGLLPTCRRKERPHAWMRLPPNQWFLVGRIAVGMKVGRGTKTSSRKTAIPFRLSGRHREGWKARQLITMLHKHDAHSSRRITTNEVTDEKQHRSNTSSQTIRKDRRPAETPCLDDHPFSPEV